MDSRWYGATCECQKCKVDTILQTLMYSADGEFNFTFYCPNCQELLYWRVFASRLQHEALKKDIEKSQAIIPAKQLRPPVRPPPEKVSEKDRQLMKDFGIDPDNGKEKK